jgi:hypothetical protein
MNQEKYLEVLRRLINLSQEYCFRCSDVRQYEPTFFAVLVYIKSASDENLRKIVENEFRLMLEEPGLRMHELIAYCMRELKFETIRESAQRLLADLGPSPRYLAQRTMLMRLLEAYEEQWSLDSTYSYFKK